MRLVALFLLLFEEACYGFAAALSKYVREMKSEPFVPYNEGGKTKKYGTPLHFSSSE